MGRRLGQHFLFDPAILDRIADAIDPTPNDVVLEVGPGLGTLTRHLAPCVGRVVAVERDSSLVERLERPQERGDEPLPGNVSVVQGDALELDWQALTGAGSFKVCGNIPYAITSPLIDKALLDPQRPLVVFLVQREVADRLAADPGGKSYGALSVGVQAVARVERLFAVKAGAFRPPPRVDSAAVRLTPLEEPLVAPADQPEFRRFVTALFGQRRKQLSGALRTVTGLDRDAVAERLAALDVDPRVRCETLPPGEFERLRRTFR